MRLVLDYETGNASRNFCEHYKNFGEIQWIFNLHSPKLLNLS